MPTAAPKVPPCLAAALDYLERGWSVLPLCPPDHQGVSGQHEQICRHPGKVPLGSWKEYTQRLPRPAELKLWWNRWRNANVGLALGPVSGLVGLDLDGSAGEAILENLLSAAGGTLPPTLEFVTPGGGRRLLFAHNDPLPNEEYHLGDGELRVLAQGRQTVMPPSLHHSGGVYAWVDGGRPDEIEPAPLPEWLLQLLLCPPTHDDQGGAAGNKPPGSKPECGASGRVGARPPLVLDRARNYLQTMGPCDPRPEHPMDASTHLLKAATALIVGFGLDEETAVALLAEWDRNNPVRPYPERELRRKCREALRASPKERGYLITDPPSTNGHSRLPPAPPFHTVNPPASAAKSAPVMPQIKTAAQLAAEDLPPLQWAIDGILPEGATLFAGPPKVGKSYLTLGLTLAVAHGGTALGRIPVQPGEVLYLALEDGWRRLKTRLHQVNAASGAAMPSALHLVTQWPRYSHGALDLFNQWLDAHPTTRLVVIDTLVRIRDKRGRTEALYEEDCAAIEWLQRLGLERRLAVLIIHHTRKQDAEDPFDAILGTQGLLGTADVAMVLRRPRYGRDGTLHVTGRDIEEERKIQLLWDKQYCLWQQVDTPAEDDAEAHLNKDQRAVRQLLREHGKPMALLEINAKLRKEYAATAQLVHRMVKDGLLKKAGYGLYALPDETPIPE